MYCKLSEKSGRWTIKGGLGVAAVVLMALSITLNAGVTFKGKPKMEKAWKVELLKMLWGPAGGTSSKDRMMGSLKIMKDLDTELPPGCTLTVEFVDGTNGVLKTSTLDVKQIAATKDGRANENKKFVPFEFAFDFAPIVGARGARLVDVQYKNESVTYNPLFNVSGTMMRSGMSLPKPNVLPVAL